MSYTNGHQFPPDEDVEEETLVADYQEQVNNYEEGAELERGDSIISGGPADLRAQLEAAAAPLEFQASLETK
jgi:translation initiation factor 3 subunit L